MHSVPDLRVWSAGNIYEEAANLLNENKKYWAAAINAALAIEIYLKAFLSEEERSYLFGDDGIYRSGSKVKFEHDFIKLYEKIPNKFQIQIDEAFVNKFQKVEFKKQLERYRDVFTKARYNFELNARTNLDNGIVYLAAEFREVVLFIAGINENQLSKTV
jgi:HEPN domain-containing protein